MTTFVVSSFPDRSAAEAAIDRLARSGVPRERIRLHEGTPAARNAALLEVDELVTGGYVSNLTALFQDLLEQPTRQGEAATYADVVRSEGTLLSVQLEQRSDAARCRDLLRAAGAFAVATLPQEDGLSSTEPTGT